ncbi:MAG TPA: choice-of-anchor L domain-containing protein [Bacteroidia bacterium]|nr:choice-of-anchor L domain-containing protein [Bacteroidia bacterium]
MNRRSSPFGISIVFLSFILMGSLKAQVTINYGLTPQQLVQTMLGIGVTATNVTFTGTLTATGGFIEPSNSFNIRNGIVLTTGSPSRIPGPNTMDSASVDNVLPGDSLLDLYTTAFTQDATILEFDFVPSSDSIAFDYVFGSEEYNEFVNSGYNDIFGFFISGPGINGVKNIALVPGTNTPVSIDSINNGYAVVGTLPTGPCTNCQYYIDNSGGVILQYDGYTTRLTAGTHVQPCATYHLRLAIADAGDGIYDSGIFIQAGSFKSTAAFNLEYNGSSSPSIINICPGECVTLSAPPLPNYLWSNGDTTQTTVACTPAFYSVSTTVGTCHAASNLVSVRQVAAPPVPVVSLSNDTAYSSVTAGSYGYQWYYNDTNAVSGATSPSLLLPFSGCFNVVVTDVNGCSSVSDSICDLSVGINDDAGEISTFDIHLLSNTILEVTIPGGNSALLSMTDLSGKIVYSEACTEGVHRVGVSGYSKGIYFLTLVTSKGVSTRRMYLD